MKAYQHQTEIIKADPVKCGLFLGTGSGKTFIALSLAKGDILVICPKTQKEDRNWEREYLKIAQSKIQEYKKGEKVKLFKPLRLTVLSKEEFRRDHAFLPHFNTVIVDEAHTCLGVTPSTRQVHREQVPKASQLFEALDVFLRRCKPERLYLCTATIVKSPFTVWAAEQLLKPMNVRDMMASFYAFRTKYYTQLPMPGRDVHVPKRDSKTKDALASLVRSIGYVGRLEDFFDVPPQSFKTEHIELTKVQEKAIKGLKLEFPDPIVLIGKKHQVENGVLSGDEYSAPELFDNNKIDRLLELAIEFPRLVVFAKYTAQIGQIDAAMRKAGHNVLLLTGATKDRGQVIKAANKLPSCIFVAQAQISAGWELPEYPCMVFASRTYSFVDYSQGLGRIQRANNIKKNLYINLVVKGGIDEAVDSSLANKQDFDERIYAKV